MVCWYRMSTVVPGTSALSHAVLNLSALRSYANETLIQGIDSVSGSKVLVMDPTLTGPLGLIASVSQLKQHAVEKIYHLTSDPLGITSGNILYLVRPTLETMTWIVNQVKAHPSSKHTIFFVPRRTLVCERVLERMGVLDEVTIYEYPLDLIPLDDDVLSLEFDTFRPCALDGDTTCLMDIAQSVMKLQSMFGWIPNVRAKGTHAVAVTQLMEQLRQSIPKQSPVHHIAPEIDTIILIDRETDLITPMCTQLTYEGLIDEVMGIQHTMVELDPEVAGTPEATRRVKHPLNANDTLYGEIRDLNFSVLGPMLNKKAQFISKNYEERHAAQTVSQIRDFMKKLGGLQQEHQSLRVHINIAEKIDNYLRTEIFTSKLQSEQQLLSGEPLDMDFVARLMDQQHPLPQVLRLVCLYSLTNNGIKSKQFDLLRRQLCHCYGYETIFTLHNLSKLGLLHVAEGKNPWPTCRKALSLLAHDIDELHPTDIAYVYSGYAPLSVRVIQHASRPGGLKAIEETLKLLPGPMIEKQYPATTSTIATSTRKVTLVYFIGGCTFTEISAIRFLGKQEEDSQRDYVVATTQLMNGTRFLNGLIEQGIPTSR